MPPSVKISKRGSCKDDSSSSSSSSSSSEKAKPLPPCPIPRSPSITVTCDKKKKPQPKKKKSKRRCDNGPKEGCGSLSTPTVGAAVSASACPSTGNPITN